MPPKGTSATSRSPGPARSASLATIDPPAAPWRSHPRRGAPRLAHANRNDLGAGTLLILGEQRAIDEHLAPAHLPHARPQFHRGMNTRRLQIRDLQRRGDTPDRRLAVDRPALGTVERRDGSADRVAVDDGGNDPAVEHIRRAGRVPRDRAPGAYCLVTVPVALDLQAVLVARAAAPAPVVRDQVLKSRFARHRTMLAVDRARPHSLRLSLLAGQNATCQFAGSLRR